MLRKYREDAFRSGFSRCYLVIISPFLVVSEIDTMTVTRMYIAD